MKFTTKNVVRMVVLVPLSFFLIFCSYIFLAKQDMLKYVDCGTVVSKSNDEVAIKHGSQTLLYLNVQFEKAGFKSIGCSPTTYFSRKVGDRVCFELENKSATVYRIYSTIGLMFLATVAIMGVVGLIVYIV